MVRPSFTVSYPLCVIARSALVRVVAGGYLFWGHRQPGHRRRGTRTEHLAQQARHRVVGVVRERAVECDVGERAISQLPRYEGGVLLAAGDAAHLLPLTSLLPGAEGEARTALNSVAGANLNDHAEADDFELEI